VLGLERERRERPDGLRTHVLVSVSTCLVILAAAFTLSHDNVGRMAQGLITGIGFLGAGTILRQGVGVRGLTTAASIWCACGVGIAVGMGAYLGAAMATAIIFGALTLLRPVEREVHQRWGDLHVRVRLAPGNSFPVGLAQYLLDNGVDLMRTELIPEAPGQVLLEVDPGTRLSVEATVALVQAAPGIEHAEVVANPEAWRRMP
jgi:putative Mg2+ transporter-C (MgtC) family protein